MHTTWTHNPLVGGSNPSGPTGLTAIEGGLTLHKHSTFPCLPPMRWVTSSWESRERGAECGRTRRRGFAHDVARGRSSARSPPASASARRRRGAKEPLHPAYPCCARARLPANNRAALGYVSRKARSTGVACGSHRRPARFQAAASSRCREATGFSLQARCRAGFVGPRPAWPAGQGGATDRRPPPSWRTCGIAPPSLPTTQTTFSRYSAYSSRLSASLLWSLSSVSPRIDKSEAVAAIPTVTSCECPASYDRLPQLAAAGEYRLSTGPQFRGKNNSRGGRYCTAYRAWLRWRRRVRGWTDTTADTVVATGAFAAGALLATTIVAGTPHGLRPRDIGPPLKALMPRPAFFSAPLLL